MTCLQSDRRKQLQRKDRVYQHVQNQMADQAAARAANKDRVERVREHVLVLARCNGSVQGFCAGEL